MFGFVSVKAALLAAADAAMGPKAFEDHFRRRCHACVILQFKNAEAVDVSEQVFNVGKLLVAILREGEVGDFQFAAEFDPVDGGFAVQVAERRGEDTADLSAG